MEQSSHAGQAASLLMVAAEASGDQHGAALVRALRERFPQLQVYGLGGDHMRAAGVETLFDVQALNVVGVVEILAKVPSGLRMASPIAAGSSTPWHTGSRPHRCSRLQSHLCAFGEACRAVCGVLH